MNTKYEFVPGDEIVIAPGRTLKRIRALVAIAALGITPGALGGYVESEKCLDVYGNAWVSGNAQVYGNAQVSGNAWVSGVGLICWFTGVGSESGTLTVCNAKDNTIQVTRGCFIGSIDEFLEASAKKHCERIQLEYLMLIEVAVSRITAAREAA